MDEVSVIFVIASKAKQSKKAADEIATACFAGLAMTGIWEAKS